MSIHICMYRRIWLHFYPNKLIYKCLNVICRMLLFFLFPTASLCLAVIKILRLHFYQ